MSGLRIVQETIADLESYGSVPMTLLVESIYRVETTSDGFQLHEEAVATPWVKDYEALDEDRPVNLAKGFDLNRWGIFVAYLDGRHVGGAIVAPPPDAWFTEKGAALVDIRVDPSARRKGVGTALVRACAGWAGERDLAELSIETQNVNVAACRFYESQGAVLAEVHRGAYPAYPEEVRLIWKLAL
jgi:GNAT superfamily N-acetyltransferase